MSYHNAKQVLPEKLIKEIQTYIDGEYLYIPRKESNRKAWGESNNSKKETRERNLEIYSKYKQGISSEELAMFYSLSIKTIYKIIAGQKNKKAP